MAPRFAKQPDWSRAVLRGERPSTHAVYAVLLAWRPWNNDHTDRPCVTASPARTVIAEETGLTERSVKRATARLVELGLIRKQHQGRGRAQLYTLAWDAPFTDDPDPVLLLAIGNGKGDTEKGDKRGQKGTRPEPVDNSPNGRAVSPFSGSNGRAVSPHREDSLEDTRGRDSQLSSVGPNSSIPPAFSQPTPDRARDDEKSGGGIETKPTKNRAADDEDILAAEVTAAKVKIRDVYLGGVWPAHPSATWRLRVWMTAGWPRDEIGHYLAERIASVAVRDPAAVVKSHLDGDPPPAPYTPDHARPAVWHAQRRKDAETREAAMSVPATRPVGAADVAYGIGAAIGSGRRDAAFLGASEARTGDMAATGTGG